MNAQTAGRFAVWAVLAAGLAVVGGQDAAAQGKKSDAVVKVTATAGKPDAEGNQVVTVTLDIEKGWHTYANPVGPEDLATAQTRVKIDGKNRPQVVKIDYPKGREEKDKVVGNYFVYEGKVDIKATVKRARAITGRWT